MKEDIKDLWVKALRSGEFKQSQGYLYLDDKYCVTGILAMLGMVNGVCSYDEKNGQGYFDSNNVQIPVSVKEWSGLKTRNGVIPSEFITLQGYNDTFGYDFDQLADIIEENWENM